MTSILLPVTNKFKPFTRGLADRSHLEFQFPVENNNIKRVYLPFLENIKVSESRKANLVNYNMLGRNSSLYGFVGGTSRQISVRFAITLPHVLETLRSDKLDDRFGLYYHDFYDVGLIGREKKTGVKYDLAQIHRSHYEKISGRSKPTPTIFDTIVNKLVQNEYNSEVSQGRAVTDVNRAINLMMFWVNLIRAGCINNADNTTLGPPIIRFNHGIMYNNVPCVMDGYNIQIVEDKGYDVNTLIPKMIEVSITLNEVRIGNFGKFESFNAIEGDNNVGWEAVLEDNNMDPFNGGIRPNGI